MTALRSSFFSMLMLASSSGAAGCTAISETAQERASASSEPAADADHDGVPDDRDKCPDTAQIRPVDPKWRYAVVVSQERISSTPKSYPVDEFGCEADKDGDGVVDSQDYCPEDTPEMLAAGVAPNGCPKQSDRDGTPDYRDDCPNTPRDVHTDRRGCPL